MRAIMEHVWDDSKSQSATCRPTGYAMHRLIIIVSVDLTAVHFSLTASYRRHQHK